MRKIGVILVTYNFSTDSILAVVDNLSKQTDCVCIIDNSSTDSSTLFKDKDKVVYLAQNKNLGIAAAQNIGIRYLVEEGYEYIIFSDQDSIIKEGVIDSLFQTYTSLQKEGYHVGAVGPRAYNKTTGTPYPHQCNYISETNLKDGTHLTEVTYVMSSLSLQRADTFKDVGLLDTSLFIDGVDSEWCWRGKNLCGLRYFVNEDIHISHQLGQGMKSVAGKKISITPPYRMFYMYRNFLWLCRKDYVPTKWKIYNGVKYIIKMLYYPLLKAPRIEYVKNIFRGIKAGMKKPIS